MVDEGDVLSKTVEILVASADKILRGSRYIKNLKTVIYRKKEYTVSSLN